jgi:tRNA A-37 threonylcarbamoyl transferase component Bud32
MSKPGEEAARPHDDPATSPATPLSASRVDSLTEDFARFLSRRHPDVGQILAGRYRILEALGGGGMGNVFIAENVSIRRRVALKLLHADLLSQPEFRKRFQQEADAIAAIEHSNVVRLFDLVVGDPTFLVMEYVPGPTLAAVLKTDKRIDPVRAMRIAQRLCLGLEAAHRAKVVHRDVKPANIILAPDAEAGENPKLVDFGVAKLTVAKPAEDQLTRTGQIVGTPYYMSPEQIAKSNLVDPRSDLYSLGCVLYHLVAGQPPFAAEDEYEIFSQHVQKMPAPPSQVCGDVPPALDAIILRALAKRPDDRFASAQEMAKALLRASPAPATGSAPEVVGFPAPPPRRSPLRLAILAASGVALLGLGYLIGHRPAPSAPTGAGALFVDSDPRGAEVELDGKPLGQKTPALATGLPGGSHRIRLRHAGYDDLEQVVELGTDQRRAVAPVLLPKSRTIEVETIPSGAHVYVDDHMLPGQTPLSISVAEGDFHGLRLERPGYKPYFTPLQPENHDPTLSVHLVPETEARGTLWVDADQSSHVYIDNVDTGLLTPTLAIDVTAGTHVIELRDGTDRVGARRKLRVGRGDTMHVTLEFKRDDKK